MSEVLPANAPFGMPKGIPPKPDPKDFEPPVAWLFGRQLIANLKWIMLYTAFKGKLDPRDWMNPNIIQPGRSSIQLNDSQPSHEEGRDESASIDESKEEFWFDYIADTGDGQKAVYSIAYLCMSDLAVKTQPQIGDQLEFVPQPDLVALKAEDKTLLPRGGFLFIGGDTSYHIADYGNLAARIQNPFCWAAKDLFEANSASVMDRLPRLLLGIPGNHDYYDALDGFNRQFRRPAMGEKVGGGGRQPLLALPTFIREQEASYLAVHLPFDWWFWGMDTEEGEIDFRQAEFFKTIQEKYRPARLIVATPEPTTVFGKYAKEQESQSKTFAALGLERPFLKNSEPIGKGKCRLDLSGDVHHYARHWGAPKGTRASNYASVMSGGGGAFFHPSHTTIKEIQPEVVYPLPGDSRRKVADQLFKFRNIWQGGYIWLFGFIIAFSLFFAATFPQSSRDAIDSFPLFIKLGISPPMFSEPQQPLLSYVQQMPRNPWWTNPLKAPSGYWLATILPVLSLILIGVALYYSSRLFEKDYDPTWSKPSKKVTEMQRIVLWTMVFTSFVSLASGILGFHAHDAILTRFGRSLIVFVALGWSVLAIIESLWYSGWLFEEVYHGNLKPWHYWPVWVLNIMAALCFGASLWFFGKQESALLVSDLALLLILLAVGGGLTYFAYSTGGNLKKGTGKVAFLLLGASHALLQLLIPFLLVRKGHLLWAPVAALIVVIIFKYIGRYLAKKENGWPLAFAWVAFGALLLVTPFVINATTPFPDFNLGPLNVANSRLAQFALCAFAGGIGAITSCVFFGWYLAVALAFNGHNNEAGGGARIEGFKEFIRFRLTREGLTGYVIAIDEPNTEGGNGKLLAKIIDVFHISDH
jgi:hypothetical protein